MGAEGLQNTPFCNSNMAGFGMYGMQGAGWQNSMGGGVMGGINSYSGLSGIYGGPYGGGYGQYGTNMYQGAWLSNCCDQYKRKFNNIYDTYDPYIPSFKY